jgi:hypothetical protein
VSSWDACTQDPHWLFRQIECHPATASWVQAILIVATIIVTAAVAQWSIQNERQRARQDRQARAAVLALRLLPPIMELRIDCNSIDAFMAAKNCGLEEMHDIKGAEYSLQVNCSLPDDIPEKLDSLEAADARIIGTLYHSLWRYKTFVATNVPKLRTMNGLEREAYVLNLKSNFGALETMVDAAISLTRHLAP